MCESQERTVGQYSCDSRHEPAECPFLFIQMASRRRGGEVDGVPSREPQGEALDKPTGPRVRLGMVLVKQDACGSIIAWAWARICYHE